MPDIHPDMTVLDLISRFRETERVIKSYDQQAGECICCNCLFDSLIQVADKYGLDRDELMSRIKGAAAKNAFSA